MSWGFYTASGIQKTTDALGSEFPVGTITDYAGAAAPTNWLLCDGSTISRSTYSQLFDVIGTAYGAGDGSTTFKIPNSSGKIIYYQRGPAVVTMTQTNAPTFVTTLPASPSDGQEVYYQASGTMATDGLVWHLRYRQGSSSTYKWEFVGGPPVTNYSQGQVPASGGVAMTASAWTTVSTATTLTVPLAGIYQVEIQATFYSNAVGEIGIGMGNNSTTSVVDNSSQYYANTNNWMIMHHRSQFTVASASHTQTLLLISLTNQTNAFRKNSVIRYTPVRVI